MQKLKEAHEKNNTNKLTRLEKKKQTLLKKKDTLLKKGQDTSTTDKMLQKVEEDLREDQLPFEYSQSIPLTRMQTESEFESKSARTKALNEALQAATSTTTIDGKDGDGSMHMGMRGLVANMRERGVIAVKTKQKSSDKNVQDILKLGSHLLK